jgi:hypothetical protein
VKRESFQQLIQMVGRHSGQAARDLLYQARSEDPSHFVLHIVAACVACRASRIQVRNDELDLVVECNGTAPSPSALADLYNSFESTSRDERTRHLALGLNSAFATGVGQLQVEAWDGRQGVRIVLSAGTQSNQALKMDPFNGQGWALRVRCLERSKFRTLARAVNHLSGAATLPEIQVLHDRCSWCGPELSVDRAGVNDEINPGRCLAWCSLAPEQPVPHLQLRYTRPRHGLELQETISVPFYAVLTLGAQNLDWTGARAVVNGVTLPPGLPLHFRDLSVVFAAPELEADVNFTGLRNTPTLEKVLDILANLGARMAADLLARKETIGYDQAETGSRIFEDLSSFLMRHERSEMALQALRAALELRESVLGATHPDLIDGWSQLLELNKRVGNEAAVLPIQERLIPLLRASGENHLRKHRVAEAATLLRRALELEEQLPEPPADLAKRFHDLAVVVKEHRLPGAEELFQRSLALQQSGAGSCPATHLQSVFELADRHRANRRYAEAEVQAREALKLAEAAHGSESKELVPFLKLLADILKAANRYGESTDYESRAMMLKYKR